MAKKKTNYGCGPNKIYTTGKNDTFYSSCVIHDTDYEDPNVNYKESDWNFLERNILIAIKRRSKWLLIKALIYFVLVRFWSVCIKKPFRKN